MTAQISMTETVNLDIRSAAQEARDKYWGLTIKERNILNAQWNEEFKDRFHEEYPEHKLVEFNDPHAKLDGVIIDKSGKIVACYEVKCRNTDIEELKSNSERGSEWIIDKSKIDAGIAFATDAKALFVGFIYCVVDKTLVRVDIFKCDNFGAKVVAPYKIEYRETSDGNSGTFSSSNIAIVSLENAKYFEVI
jgi:hypothetical protein